MLFIKACCWESKTDKEEEYSFHNPSTRQTSVILQGNLANQVAPSSLNTSFFSDSSKRLETNDRKQQFPHMVPIKNVNKSNVKLSFGS